MSANPGPLANRLLSVLPDADYRRLLPFLERAAMPAGQPLFEQGAQVPEVWFPTTAVVSLMRDVQESRSSQVAMVGHEGLVGISVFMGGQPAADRAVVLCAGEGYRLAAPIMLREFNREGPLNRLALRYTQALLSQMSQTA